MGDTAKSAADASEEVEEGCELSSDGSDEDDDEEQDEVEPKLRYERLRNDVPHILTRDAASCVAIHTKFLALGTHLGVIHILDHQGNNIHEKELVLHVTTVNQISIDEKGDYIASCSNDGKVVLHGLCSAELNASIVIDRPVRSIALDPFISKSSGRRFIIGEDKVVLYEKSFLSRYKPTVLYQGEGPIRNIQWKSEFVVWASDKTVRVYDLSANVTISVIQRDCDPKLRSDMYRCNFFWQDKQTLLIGWANAVKVCSIVQTQTQQMPANLQQGIAKDQVVPRHCVVITSMFMTEFCICGISVMGPDIVVLTVLKDTEISGNVGLRPQLRVLKPFRDDFKPIFSDVLMLHGYQEYRCNDYHIDSFSEEGLYFILSPKDFVVARPRDEDDHVGWLLQHDMYKEALEAVLESKHLRRFTLLQVGQMYLDFLLQMKRYDDAACLCPKIFGTNKRLWEEEVYKFARICQLRCVAPFLPIGDEPLEPGIYEMVLNEYLQKDTKGFLELVRKWPSSLYHIPTIVSAVKDRMHSPTATPSPASALELHESLCELYIYDQKYDEALALYIKIKNKDRVFSLIQKYNLFKTVYDKIELLMELNPKTATVLFIDNVEKIPIDHVVSKLQHKPQLLFEYLPKVILKDRTMGEEHHGLLVELYAEFAPQQLESFLRSSNNYALEHAFDICQQRNLVNEMIFLLGRMGNTKQALQQITHELQDINRAIEFCKEHNDQELWEDLIECSLEKPDFIRVLLENIGTHVDPIILIQKIPTGLKIPGLRDALVQILQDYNLQISLREGCEKILVSDCFSLLEKLNRQQRKGILVSADQVCQACDRKLLILDPRRAVYIYVFNCKHAFHEACISVDRNAACTICIEQKRLGTIFGQI